jgi:drug/metabolite transporter (DMT)-like permease
VELVGPARAGQYLHLMPVFGVLLAVLFLGETLHSYHIPGIALIATGLWLAR